MDSKQLVILRRHNERIGIGVQPAVQRCLFINLIGPIMDKVLRAAFRIELHGDERLDGIGDRAIFAVQHFFEWDPFVSYCCTVWRRSRRARHLAPYAIASSLWTQTRLLRLASWALGVMSVVKGHEPQAGAIERASRLLRDGAPVTVAIFPTGPLGQRKTYQIHPGVAHLSMSCPSVPIVPVAVTGLQDIDFLSVLNWERPQLVLHIGRPFCAEEINADGDEEKLAAICNKIREEWDVEASAVAAVQLVHT